jgi:hypothetical protein
MGEPWKEGKTGENDVRRETSGENGALYSPPPIPAGFLRIPRIPAGILGMNHKLWNEEISLNYMVSFLVHS